MIKTETSSPEGAYMEGEGGGCCWGDRSHGCSVQTRTETRCFHDLKIHLNFFLTLRTMIVRKRPFVHPIIWQTRHAMKKTRAVEVGCEKLNSLKKEAGNSKQKEGKT